MQATIGLLAKVLADTGCASGPAVEALQTRGVEPLVAIGRTQPHRPYARKAKLDTDHGKALYKKSKQTAGPVFGIIKSAMDFRNFHLRGLPAASCERTKDINPTGC